MSDPFEELNKKRKRAFLSAWRSKVFLRKPHDTLLKRLFANADGGGLGFWSGLYLIACDDKIVYIGQSQNLPRRLPESLGRIYHQVTDTNLPWSVGFANTRSSSANELESSAIREFAPIFNTSIPNKEKSFGGPPAIVGISPVFADQQDNTTHAFNPDNLKRQSELALTVVDQPWKQGKRKRRTSEEVRAEREAIALAKKEEVKNFEWNEETKKAAMRDIGVSLNSPLAFTINLIEDGSVLTNDGEYIGAWELDENGFYHFISNRDDDFRTLDPFMGILCKKIEDWFKEKID